MTDISLDMMIIRQEVVATAMSWAKPSVIYKPKLEKSGYGDGWYAIYGEFSSFGKTPAEAMENFDKEWYKGDKI